MTSRSARFWSARDLGCGGCATANAEKLGRKHQRPDVPGGGGCLSFRLVACPLPCVFGSAFEPK
jgi:hypothetical protein